MTRPILEADDERRPVGVSLLFALAAAVIVLAGFSQIGDLFSAAFLALTLIITVRPLFTWLVERSVPRPLASVACSALVLLFIFGLVALIGMSIAQLAQTLPQYASRFTAVYRDAIAWLSGFGLDEGTISRGLSSVNFNSLLSTATGLLSSIGQGSGQLVTLIIVIVFMGVDTTQIVNRTQWLQRDQPSMLTALSDFGVRVRQYWLVSTGFGLLVAVLDTIFLSFMNIPLAITWGVFAFVTNYIPNVGFVLGLIPPALMALLSHDLPAMIIVIVGYSIINFFFQTMIQPKFTGDAVGLNTTVTFLSLLFWVSILGGLGAIMAVPLTLFLKAVFIDSSPRTMWLGVFLQARDVPADAPPEGFRNPLDRDARRQRRATNNKRASRRDHFGFHRRGR
ncbi:AI-2E family transporter [Propionicicella superfundia]|uniref:AI-2E family transporter n=1 Tax=Propionicicella superfundia TaxID=348582 RepID=UPI0003F8B7AF|nr:AI-2E family transporter [Propionicicella superfundia]